MRIRNQQGQALVELAISLFLLMLIVFGITEFGRAMYLKNMLTNAAREGARRASIGPKTVDVKAYVSGKCFPSGFDLSSLDVAPVWNTTSPTDPTVTVTVTMPFKAVVPLIIPSLSSVTLKGQATMRYEGV